MRKVSIVAAIVMMTAVLGCEAKQEEATPDPSQSAAPTPVKETWPEPTWTGKVSAQILKVDQRELPENTVLKLEIRHITDLASRSTETIATKSMPVTELPVSLVIEYDKSKLEQRQRYILHATLSQDEEMLYGTDVEIPVLTYGGGESAQIVLKHKNIMRERHLNR